MNSEEKIKWREARRARTRRDRGGDAPGVSEDDDLQQGTFARRHGGGARSPLAGSRASKCRTARVTRRSRVLEHSARSVAIFFASRPPLSTGSVASSALPLPLRWATKARASLSRRRRVPPPRRAPSLRPHPLQPPRGPPRRPHRLQRPQPPPRRKASRSADRPETRRASSPVPSPSFRPRWLP